MSLTHKTPFVLTHTYVLWLLLLISANLQGAGPGVHGRVLGHDSAGKLLGVVPSARIEFQSLAGAKATQTVSNENGYFKVDLPTGDYLYKVQAEGYRSEDVGRGLRLKQTEGYSVFNLALTQGRDEPNRQPPELASKPVATLQGKVLEKTKTGSTGIGGARIALRREGSLELIFAQSRHSNDNQLAGDYRLALEPGTYHASVLAKGFDLLIDPEPIKVKPGTMNQHDFFLTHPVLESVKGQGIRGVVTVIDSDTTPPPIKVQILTLKNSLPPIDVEQGGNITFRQDLPVGHYRVVASAEGYPNSESPPIYVMQGKYTRVSLALRAKPVPAPHTSVELFVYEKLPTTGSQSPLAGAKVSLWKEGTSPLQSKESITDKSGHAIIPVDQPGEYLAEAQLTGYRLGTGRGQVTLNKTHALSIEMTKNVVSNAESTLVVEVKDATSNRPLFGSKILARMSGQSIADSVRGVSDAQGQATLKLEREGSYTVMAQATGYEPGGGEVVVSSIRSNRISVALKPTSAGHDRPTSETNQALIKGYVAYRESSGQLRSVPNTNLIWKLVAAGQTPYSQFATTSNEGKYQIQLMPGHYEVQVKSPPGFEHTTEFVDVLPGQQEKYFIIGRTERAVPDSDSVLVDVTGVVLAETKTESVLHISKADILFLSGTASARATSNQNGQFALRLRPGSYQVHVRATGFETLTTKLNVAQGMVPARLILSRSVAPDDQQPSTTTTLLNIMAVARGRNADKLMFPIPSALVQLKQGGRSLFSGQTNALGKYSISVKPGQYTVVVSKPGFADATSDLAIAGREFNHQMILSKSENSGTDTSRTLTLTVHVSRRSGPPSTTTKPTGPPVPGARVVVMRGSQQQATGLTNAAGNYVVQLPAGSYAVKVSSAGQAPAGKTFMLTTQSAGLNFELDATPSSASANEADSSATGASQGIREILPLGRMTTIYIVEHRDNARSPWIVLGEYSSQREAQAALFRAVEHHQIPGGAPAESRIRTATRLNRQGDRK